MTFFIARLHIVAGIAFLAFGLWQHDWHLILAAVVLMLIGPLIMFEAEDHRADRRRRERLDRLWDDDELSDSA